MAIVAYREENGPFTTVEQLQSVKGVGEKVLEQNRASLSVK
jgi:competence protein ComEA